LSSIASSKQPGWSGATPGTNPGSRFARSGLRTAFEESLLERRRWLEKEHEHRAALGRRRRVAAPLGADNEIAGGAFALGVEQRAFQNEGLLEILVNVLRNAGARFELGQYGQHAGRWVVINHFHLVARRGLDPRQRLGLDEARGKRG